ncbi:MAG: hypothetical protein WC975_03800 [Phycisphaerae bacterium]
MTRDFLLKTSTHQEFSLNPEELRLMVENDSFSQACKIQAYERCSSGELTLLDLPRLNSRDGMILWYKNCADARNAFLNLSRLAEVKHPPVTIMANLADLESFELSHGVAIRSCSLFESRIERWLKELNLSPIEEETEHGPQVMEYFLQHAKILQSANLIGTPAPRTLDELVCLICP